MRMKKFFSLLLVVVMVLSASLVLAQPMKGWKGWRGSGGWGMGTNYQRLYNSATVETVSGIIESIDKITPMKGMNYGIQLLLKTEKETLPVHLGPGWYIERLDIKLEKGDNVQVTGSRVNMMGKTAIIAAEIMKADQKLILRDSSGIPVWAGWRR